MSSQENELENLEAETQRLLTQMRQPVAKAPLSTSSSKALRKPGVNVGEDKVNWDGTPKAPGAGETAANTSGDAGSIFERERGRINDTADDYLPNAKVTSLVQEKKRFSEQAALLDRDEGKNGHDDKSFLTPVSPGTYQGPALQLPDLNFSSTLDNAARPLSATSLKSERSLGPLSGRSWNGYADDFEAEFDVEDEFGYNLGAPLSRVNSRVVDTPTRRKVATPRQIAAENVQRRAQSANSASPSSTSTAVLSSLNPKEPLGPTTASSMSGGLSEQETKDATLLRNDGKALFLPDGSANVNLRDTVRHALRVTRFDSVSTIMAHGSNVLKGSKKGRGGANTTYELGPLRHKAKELSLAASFAMGGKRGKKRGGARGGAQSPDMMDAAGHPKSLRDVSYSGFDGVGSLGASRASKRSPGAGSEDNDDDDENASLLQTLKKPDNVCFGCWSSGNGNKCGAHKAALNDRSGTDSMLICRNWDLGSLRYRYRSEDMQESEMADKASLRWDAERQRFVVTYVSKHATYRATNGVVERYDHGYARLRRWRAWIRSLVEDIRLGRAGARTNRPSMLRLRRTLLNNSSVVRFTLEIKEDIPLPPTTSTRDMSFNADRVAADPDHPGDPLLRLIVEVVPQPVALFQARPYDMLPRRRARVRSFFMAPPVVEDEVALSEQRREEDDGLPYGGRLMRAFRAKDTNAVAAIYAARRRHRVRDRRTYLRATARNLAQSVLARALLRLDSSRNDLLRQEKVVERTKAVSIDSEIFGEYFCKRGRGPTNIAVGGLSRGVCLAELVLTFIPQQYGRYVVINKRVVAPNQYTASKAETVAVPIGTEKQGSCLRGGEYRVTFDSYSPAPTHAGTSVTQNNVSNLNWRRPPSITASCSVVDSCIGYAEDDPNKLVDPVAAMTYHGANREQQTGEAVFHGFRTTGPGIPFPLNFETIPNDFIPTSEVAVPNKAAARPGVATTADREYPFCKPSSRQNTYLDFYHLLPGSIQSPNDPCFFTNIPKQHPGHFQEKNNLHLKMGPLVMHIYRSFSYSQTGEIEKFVTDDGEDYWFNKRTGETYWEAPIDFDAAELTDKWSPEQLDARNSGNINQEVVRKHMMMSHEQLVLLDQQRMESKLFAIEDAKHGDQHDGADTKRGEAEKNKKKLRPKPTMALLEFPEELPGTSVIRRSKAQNTSTAIVPTADQNDGLMTPRTAKGADRLGPQLWKNDLGEGIEMTPRTARSSSGDDAAGGGSSSSGGGGGSGRVDYQALSKQRPPQQARKAAAAASAAGTSGGKNVTMKRVGGGFSQPSKQKAPRAIQHQQQQLPVQPGQMMGMPSQQDLVSAITVALQSALPSIMGKSGSGGGGGGGDGSSSFKQDLIGLGLGLGLGLGMRQQQQQQQQQQQNMLDRQQGQEEDEDGEGELDVEGEALPGQQEEDASDEETPDTEAQKEEKEASALALMLTPTPDAIENDTHAAAGKGTTHHRLTKDDDILPLVKSKPELPENFLTAVFEPHVGRQHVDYLPNEPNMNEATYCAAVRPRNMMEDWLETGFDPWAEGREPTATDFRKHLPGEGSDEEDDNPFADKRGALQRKLKVEADAKVSEIMDRVISLARHGRYDEIDEIVSSPDFVHSIDSKDSKGNTLLVAAAQNGNKRIAKLALRKGADINLRNLTGQTALHFAFAYGYEELGNYLISKGADDSLTNAEGLTCYEGLSLQALENM